MNSTYKNEYRQMSRDMEKRIEGGHKIARYVEFCEDKIAALSARAKGTALIFVSIARWGDALTITEVYDYNGGFVSRREVHEMDFATILYSVKTLVKSMDSDVSIYCSDEGIGGAIDGHDTTLRS